MNILKKIFNPLLKKNFYKTYEELKNHYFNLELLFFLYFFIISANSFYAINTPSILINIILFINIISAIFLISYKYISINNININNLTNELKEKINSNSISEKDMKNSINTILSLFMINDFFSRKHNSNDLKNIKYILTLLEKEEFKDFKNEIINNLYIKLNNNKIYYNNILVFNNIKKYGLLITFIYEITKYNNEPIFEKFHNFYHLNKKEIENLYNTNISSYVNNEIDSILNEKSYQTDNVQDIFNITTIKEDLLFSKDINEKINNINLIFSFLKEVEVRYINIDTEKDILDIYNMFNTYIQHSKKLIQINNKNKDFIYKNMNDSIDNIYSSIEKIKEQINDEIEKENKIKYKYLTYCQ